MTRKNSGPLSLAQVTEILDLIPEKFRPGVLSGQLLVQPQSMWYNSSPVIIDATTKRLKSGRYNTANDLGVISKQYAFKRTKGYREIRDMLIPATKDENKNAIVSLQEIVENLWQACLGSPQKVKIPCPHPDECPEGGVDHVVAYAFKKDPGALFKFYENIVGRATETAEINVNNQSLVQMFSDPTPVTDIQVIDVTPTEMYERKQLLEGKVIDESN